MTGTSWLPGVALRGEQVPRRLAVAAEAHGDTPPADLIERRLGAAAFEHLSRTARRADDADLAGVAAHGEDILPPGAAGSFGSATGGVVAVESPVTAVDAGSDPGTAVVVVARRRGRRCVGRRRVVTRRGGNPTASRRVGASVVVGARRRWSPSWASRIGARRGRVSRRHRRRSAPWSHQSPVLSARSGIDGSVVIAHWSTGRSVDDAGDVDGVERVLLILDTWEIDDHVRALDANIGFGDAALLELVANQVADDDQIVVAGALGRRPGSPTRRRAGRGPAPACCPTPGWPRAAPRKR